MSLKSWLSSMAQPRRRRSRTAASTTRKQPSKRRVFLEALEDRRLLAVVYNANDAFVANELGASETNSSFGQFSVGYSGSLGSLTPFAAAAHTNAWPGNGGTPNVNLQGFAADASFLVPSVVVNISASPQTGYGSPADASQIVMHPGNTD